MPSATMPYPKKRATVLGHDMAYVETGQGDPIVFLHGNPTSSYLWRNVIPHLEKLGRCIAPDLIGMGDSDKLDTADPRQYRLVAHRAYLDALLDAIGVTRNAILVVHDWGSALGFDWAMRHPDRVAGIAYMEAILSERRWSDFPAGRDRAFRMLRSPAGEQKVLEENYFIETILPKSIIRPLAEEEMAQYRAPFLTPGISRLPTLVWPRELPIEGEPADVIAIVEAYGRWMAQSSIPKLFINAEPGAILIGAAREFCRTWPNQTEITVPGIHFIQEDAPDEIGQAVAQFVRGIRTNAA
jgi:haloalkane dehalogenase